MSEKIINENKRAFELLQSAYNIDQAKDDKEFVSALDENLLLWVDIETNANKKNNHLPQSFKKNLFAHSDMIKKITFAKNLKMNQEDKDFIITTNLTLCETLLDSKKYLTPKDNAEILLTTTHKIADAYDTKDEKALDISLNKNLDLWLNIKANAKSNKFGLNETQRSAIIELADSSTQATILAIKDRNINALKAILNYNLNTCETLLKAHEMTKIL